MRCLYIPPVKCAGEPCFKGSPDIILMQVVWRVVRTDIALMFHLHPKKKLQIG